MLMASAGDVALNVPLLSAAQDGGDRSENDRRECIQMTTLAGGKFSHLVNYLERKGVKKLGSLPASVSRQGFAVLVASAWPCQPATAHSQSFANALFLEKSGKSLRHEALSNIARPRSPEIARVRHVAVVVADVRRGPA